MEDMMECGQWKTSCIGRTKRMGVVRPNRGLCKFRGRWEVMFNGF